MRQAPVKTPNIDAEEPAHDCKYLALLLEAENVIFRAENAIAYGWMNELHNAIARYKERRAMLISQFRNG